MIVYLLTCLTTGKKYVGCTVKTLERRWYEHVRGAMCKESRPRLVIHQAIKKHGENNFKREVLITCSYREEMHRVEAEKIVELNTFTPNGYNVARGGQSGFMGHPRGEKHPMFGKKHSEETKRLMSEKRQGRKPMLGKKHSDETKQLMSQSQAGKHKVDYHRIDCPCGPCKASRGEQCGEKNPMFGKKPKVTEVMIEASRLVGLANKGKVRTEEQTKKISEALKGRPSKLKGVKQSQEVKEVIVKAQRLRRAREKQIAAVLGEPLWYQRNQKLQNSWLQLLSSV